MSDPILRVFTPEQLAELGRNKILSDNVGLTNFNVGSRNLTLLEAFGAISSMLGLDFIEGLRRSIPVMLYDGLNFKKKGATRATGFFRYTRLPAISIRYTGAGTSCLMTINSSSFSTVVTGAGDNLNLSFATYPTLSQLVAAIDGHSAYTATLVQPSQANDDPADLYDWAAYEIIGSINYLNQTNGTDLLTGAASIAIIPSGASATLNGVPFQTTAASTIPAGLATSPNIAAQAVNAGIEGNISALAIDTMNGKGTMTTSIANAQYVINNSSFTGGTNEESEDDRALRFQIYAQGLSGSTERGLQAAALSVDGIRSATVRVRYPQNGQNTVVADDGTGNLSLAQQAAVTKVLNGDPNDFTNFPGFRAAGILCNVIPPVSIPVDVGITVYRIGEISDESEISIAVQTAIENYINKRRLGDDVVVSAIIDAARSAHPAVYDVTISTPLVNVSITKDQLARTGSGSGAAVTVTMSTLPNVP